MRIRTHTIRPLDAVLGMSAAIGLDLWTGGALSSLGTAPGEVHAVTSLVLLILSVGLSLLAGYLLRKNQKNPVQDERPTPLASRGSYCAWFRGWRRLGYVMTWAGERTQRKEEIDGGKGDLFSGPEQTVYVESAMHVICVGPVDALFTIEQGGKVIFEGPITPQSHPSGTLVDIGGEGSFRIFWGEDDQPVNTFLGAAGRIGVSSRWPNFCYVEWRGKRLGSSPVWQMMSYTVRQKPSGNYLVSSERWHEPTLTLDGETFTPFHSVSGVNNTITIDGDLSAKIRPLNTVRLTGNALSDRDLSVLSTSVATLTIGSPPFIFVIGYRTTITFEEDLTGIDTNGQIQLYSQLLDDGANAAHVIADMLFEKWPQGASLSTSFWDLSSLETMGVDTDAEELRTSWVAQEARTVEERLGGGLQDLGYMVPIDTASGLVKFQPLREPVGPLKNLDNKVLVDVLPELDKFMGERPVDFLIFGFSDRALNFRDMTIGRMEDGQIGFLEVARARPVALTVTTHFDTAVAIANRRSQEELTQNAVWTIETNRYTREFLPGEAITADFTSEVLRVLEVQAVPDSNRVQLKVMVDSYGIQASKFTDNAPPIQTGLTPAQQDIAFAMIEVPEYLTDVPPQTVIIPRIRAHNQIVSAKLHLSSDGTSFQQIAGTTIHNPGGQLTTAMSATGLYEPDDGTVQFTALGPDIADVQDLSADVTNWRLGRQVVIFASTAGVEIAFCKKVTIVSGNTYSIDGLIRARYDTKRLAHPTGAQVFFVNSQQMTALQDPLLVPQVTRYCKTQPAGNGVVPLSIVPAIAAALYGKGIRPPAVSALRVTAPQLVNAYSAGDNVTVEWDYATPRTPGTSAGLQAAGVPTGTTDPEGPFLLEILTLAEAVVRTANPTSATFTYSNTDLVSDLGSEVSFKVRVSQMRDGYLSDSVTLTVEKV